MEINPLEEYIIHLEAATNLIEDTQSVITIQDKKNHSVRLMSESEKIDFLVRAEKNAFYIDDKIADISYQYKKESDKQICIRQRIKENTFETTYEVGECGQIELIKAVNEINEHENQTVIICERKEYDDEYDDSLDEYEYDEEDDEIIEDFEEEKEELYSKYQVRINGKIIPYEQAINHIEAFYEKTIYLNVDSEDRIIEYMDLVSSIEYHLQEVQKNMQDESKER